MAAAVLRDLSGLHGHVAGEAMRLVTVLFALLLVRSVGAEELRLESGTLRPYQMNRARVMAEDGFAGVVELYGRLWDGRSVPLFRSVLAVESRSLELTFYLDEDIRGLECRSGSRMATLDLAALEGQRGPGSLANVALRSRMRSLDPPVPLVPRGEAPEQFSLVGTDLVMAGIQASVTLFGFVIPRTVVWVLVGFAACALVVSAIEPRCRVWALVLLAGASMTGTLAVLKTSGPGATLFSVTFPGDGPGARVAGVLERRIEKRPDYTLVAYSGGGEGGLGIPSSERVDLVGLWVPQAAGIPLEDVVAPGACVRFSAPPLVTVRDGEAFLSSSHFITGWVVHGL
jgi:hypothetical protein